MVQCRHLGRAWSRYPVYRTAATAAGSRNGTHLSHPGLSGVRQRHGFELFGAVQHRIAASELERELVELETRGKLGSTSWRTWEVSPWDLVYIA
ncbi:hypothetical protein VTO73DRAFT_5636 [Trametes versicolor]